MDGLGFFNKGEHSGQSVKHKHLQFIPLPILDEENPIPIEDLLFSDHVNETQIFTSKKVPFDNYCWNIPSNVENITELLLENYNKTMNIMKKAYGDQVSYNFLLTKKWITYIPRKTSSYGKVSCNATGFAGSLFVKSEDEIEVIRQNGVLKILGELGFKQ